MGTLTALADRMTLRTHSLGESPAALLQRTWPVLLGGTDRHSEEQKQDREPDGHFEHSQVDSEHRKGLPFLPRTALRKINLPEAKANSIDGGDCARQSSWSARCGLQQPRLRFVSSGTDSVRHQGRKGHRGKDAPGHAPENELPQPRMSVATHDQEICRHRLRRARG